VQIKCFVWFLYIIVIVIEVVTRIMANVPTVEFQKLRPHLTESLRLGYENTIHQHPDADVVMERARGVLTAIARQMGCTPASVGGCPKWTPNVQNMAENMSNLHQLLKGKQPCGALYGMYTEALHDLTVVLKERTSKGETDKTTITAPPSNEEFREQRRRKLKPTDDADKRVRKPTTSTTGVNDPQLRSKPEVPIRNFFDPLK
jgi:hypothetical protein